MFLARSIITPLNKGSVFLFPQQRRSICLHTAAHYARLLFCDLSSRALHLRRETFSNSHRASSQTLFNTCWWAATSATVSLCSSARDWKVIGEALKGLNRDPAEEGHPRSVRSVSWCMLDHVQRGHCKLQDAFFTSLTRVIGWKKERISTVLMIEVWTCSHI